MKQLIYREVFNLYFMKKIRYWLIQLLGISKSEANGAIFLFLLLFLMIITPFFIKTAFSNKYSSQLSDSLLLDSILVAIEIIDKTSPEEQILNFSNNIIPRNFDPNKASINKLITNGFSIKQAQNIYNYRESGGKFRIKKDLLKIYSVDSNLYLAMAPYLLLPDNYANKTVVYNTAKKFIPNYPKKELIAFDINTSDTTTVKQIRGIGSILSNRIVKYRESLGGFIHINQLNEVYGLEEYPLEKLKESSFIGTAHPIKQININTTDYFTLYHHPYINKKIANAIIKYRNQHSNYQSVDDLKNIHLIPSELFEKIKPYLTTNTN